MEKDEIFLKRKLRKNGRKTTLFCQRISANFSSVPVENIRVRICVYLFNLGYWCTTKLVFQNFFILFSNISHPYKDDNKTDRMLRKSG